VISLPGSTLPRMTGLSLPHSKARACLSAISRARLLHWRARRHNPRDKRRHLHNANPSKLLDDKGYDSDDIRRDLIGFAKGAAAGLCKSSLCGASDNACMISAMGVSSC
jgi:hypothetical protein